MADLSDSAMLKLAEIGSRWGNVRRLGGFLDRLGTRGMRFVRRHPQGVLLAGVPVAYGAYRLPERMDRAMNNVSPENIYRY